MEFRGYYHPPYFEEAQGLLKSGGQFWIGFIDDDDSSDGMIRINLKIPTDEPTSRNFFASITAHYDGVKCIRKLEEIGFLRLFEEIRASTFYDVVQCCVRCDIPIAYHGDQYTREVTPRAIYELLYGEEES